MCLSLQELDQMSKIYHVVGTPTGRLSNQRTAPALLPAALQLLRRR